MELVDKVYEIIEKAMCAYYTGDFTLTIDGNQWKLSLDLNQWKAPLVLVYEGDEEGFFEFLEKELRNRQAFEKPSVANRKKIMRAIYIQKLQQVEE